MNSPVDSADRSIEVVEQRIAEVLGRAHRAALAADAPDEARTILEVAQSFAEKLATADPGFDRLAFLATATATEDRS